MRTFKRILLTTLVCVTSLVHGQDYTFKVLAAKGNNEVKSGAEWQPLKTGASLRAGDEVKLGDNAYVGLVHNTGKPVEVKEPGVYPVSALESKVSAGTSVLNKYTDFILSSNDERRNSMSATGAVHRDISTGAAIHVLLPDNQRAGFFDNRVVISWDGSKVAGPYVVTLKNMFEDVLAKEETSDSTYTIDLSVPKYLNENAILVEISSKADPKQTSKQHLLKRLPPADQQKVAEEVNQIRREMAEETPLNQLLLAGFYEQKGLVIDAITAHARAIELAPDVPEFRESYEEFLQRNSLK